MLYQRFVIKFEQFTPAGTDILCKQQHELAQPVDTGGEFDKQIVGFKKSVNHSARGLYLYPSSLNARVGRVSAALASPKRAAKSINIESKCLRGGWTGESAMIRSHNSSCMAACKLRAGSRVAHLRSTQTSSKSCIHIWRSWAGVGLSSSQYIWLVRLLIPSS